MFLNCFCAFSTAPQKMPSVSLSMLRFVIAYTLVKALFLATSNPFLATRSQPFLVVLRIAIAELSLVLNSMPAYSPSVASRTHTKSSCFSAFLYVLIGLMLAYSSNFWRMLTATLRGAFGTGTVVVGPLKQASDSSSSFHTSGEMYEVPPFFSHHSDPASHGTSSTLELQTFKTFIIALTSSGPIPSPLITAAVLLAKSERRRFFRYLFYCFDLRSTRATMLLSFGNAGVS